MGAPLIQAQVLPYLRALVADGFEIHLLTFERRRMPTAERAATRSKLAGEGIWWRSLRYHAWPSLPATLFDIGVGAAWSLVYCWRRDIRIVHARSHVPAAMGLVARGLLGSRLLFDMRGLLAEEYVDAGHWPAHGLKYRLTKAMERLFFRRADAIVMLTRRIRSELMQREPALAGRGADIEVIPCSVDIVRFRSSGHERLARRAERGWTDRVVLAYVGQLGTWYLAREMARFFAALHRAEPRAYFAVFTQGPGDVMRQALGEEGVGPEDSSISYVPPAQLAAVLCASDAGISFIQPSYSKHASSPTKIGEYLAAGLPVVTNAGVGDMDELFGEGDVGVLVTSLDAPALRAAADRLIVLLREPGTRTRCVETAGRELGLATVGGPRYVALLRRLADDAAG